jgi:hypothetical protein
VEEWEWFCNLNPTYRVMCNDGDIPFAGTASINMTANEFGALKALLNPDSPLESSIGRKGEVNRLYGAWINSNGTRYIIGLHTLWKVP